MQGIWTALITPFTKNGEIDLSTFKKILQEQIDAGVSGVIPCGTTGESPTLTTAEKKTLILTAISELKGTAVKIVAGTGSNNTQETIELSRWADQQGVQGLLLVTPYYNKPSQKGLESHFLAVAESVSCHCVLYNVPGRTGVTLNVETVAKLASHPRIRALKESSGNTAIVCETLDHLAKQNLSLDILSGDDIHFLPSLAIGATGVISVASNLFPKAMVQIYKEFLQGNMTHARQLHQKYYPLFRDLFIESNPAPLKYAMHYAGKAQSCLRLPLVPLTSASQEKLQASLLECKIPQGSFA